MRKKELKRQHHERLPEKRREEIKVFAEEKFIKFMVGCQEDSYPKQH
jgi:hypothetical protein